MKLLIFMMILLIVVVVYKLRLEQRSQMKLAEKAYVAKQLERITNSDGEKIIFSELQNLSEPKKIYMKSDVPQGNGGVEIDLIVVTEHGIFIVESKDCFGTIHVNPDSRNWTQVFNKKENFSFYNPIFRNGVRKAALESYLQLNMENIFKSYVVFNGCELSLPDDSRELNVLKSDALLEKLQDIIDNSPKVLTMEQIKSIDDKLRPIVRENSPSK